MSLSELQLPGFRHDGVNIAPGPHDDGWEPPPPVLLNDGSHIQLYKDGEALHAAFEAIRNAKKRIGLEVYIFRSDETGRAFADLLCAKAASGVEVFVIYDSFGCYDSDQRMFHAMSRAGIRLAEFHPVYPWKCRYSWRLFNRDHRKLLLIDDDVAGLGGLNIGNEYAGSWIAKNSHDPWRDNAVGIRGPASRRLFHAFAKAWHYATHAGRIRHMEYLHNLDEGEFGVLATAPTRKSPAKALSKLLHNAQHSVLMSMSYFAPPDCLIDALCSAAKRNVKVRLLLPGVTDFQMLLTAARSFYDRLLSSGVEIHERQGCILHAKTTCIDGYITILGSTNLDYRSIECNCELSMILRNHEFGQHIHSLFENDIHFSNRIESGQWARRPYLDRFLQAAILRVRRLL